jgi:hypothetical protein
MRECIVATDRVPGALPDTPAYSSCFPSSAVPQTNAPQYRHIGSPPLSPPRDYTYKRYALGIAAVLESIDDGNG